MPSEGNTTDRGYGSEHQRIRARMVRAMRPGTICVRCGQPMYKWQRLQLGHGEVPASQGGKGERLEHGVCNESAGGLAAAAKRRRVELPEW